MFALRLGLTLAPLAITLFRFDSRHGARYFVGMGGVGAPQPSLTETTWSVVMANNRVCTVPNCAATHFGRGYCVKHYKRWSKYGDPLGGGTEWGAAQRFIEDAAKTNSDDCIVYPFYRNPDGYGWMRYGRSQKGSHVVVAILANGEKPSPKHEACHTCGNGHNGCVNPRHIYWGLRSDNVRDAYRHGTAFGLKHSPRGQSAYAAKYSDALISDIRDALKAGETTASIANRTGVSQAHVSRIKHGARPQPSPAGSPQDHDHK